MAGINEGAWLRSETACEPVAAYDGNTATKIWFKKVVDHAFCHHVTQIQLATDSHDQGVVDFKDQGSWTWFELVILADETSTEPKRSMDGKELVWSSHSNRLSNQTSPTRHFGAIFDRRSDLLVNLEVYIRCGFQSVVLIEDRSGTSSLFASVLDTQGGSTTRRAGLSLLGYSKKVCTVTRFFQYSELTLPQSYSFLIAGL